MVVLSRGGRELTSWPLELVCPLDLSVVDDLARMQLAARRLGCSIGLRDAWPELTELLELLGLGEAIGGVADVAGCVVGGGRPWVPLQVGGEAEGSEERGVEEVVVSDDPVA